jgi:hypothetical protein
MLSTLWIDEPGAELVVQDDAWLGTAMRAFIRDGYAIIPKAVSHQAIDRYLKEVDRTVGAREGLKAIYCDRLTDVEDATLTTPLTKVLDTYMFAPSALDIMFAPKVNKFLKAVFRDDVLAHQGLHFEVGSTQAIHQDTLYVVVDRPLNLAAAWVALEDIQEGSGELTYYPGSHRFPQRLFGGDRKHWAVEIDGPEAHSEHLAWLHDEAGRRGIAAQSFLPKKGDVLIWHADLAHGGGAITRPGVTRRSLVTHYCPLANTPYYFQGVPHAKKIPVGRNAVSSYYYDRPLTRGGLGQQLRSLLNA